MKLMKKKKKIWNNLVSRIILATLDVDDLPTYQMQDKESLFIWWTVSELLILYKFSIDANRLKYLAKTGMKMVVF